MPLDPAAKTIIDMLVQNMPQVETMDDAAEARRLVREARPPMGDPEPVGSSTDRTIPGPAGPIPVRVYTPLQPAGAPAPGIVFFHGGGWVICDLDSHDAQCRMMTNAVGAVVVSVDYRLAPEHKFPAAAEDCYAATQWTAEHASELGVDPARLAVAGDSAGGNLSGAVALMARDRGGPALAYQLMIYPVIDSSAARNDYPSKADNGKDYFLTTEAMDWYRNHYVPEGDDGTHPYLSPKFADVLSGLPPAYIVTAEFDPLRDEGEEYGRLLQAAGVPVIIERVDGMFHGFFGMGALLEPAKQCNETVFAAMRAALTS